MSDAIEPISVVEDLDPEPPSKAGLTQRLEVLVGIFLLVAVLTYVGWQWWHAQAQTNAYNAGESALTAEDWDALKEGNFRRFPEREQVALAYAVKRTRHPQGVSEADFPGLKKHFNDAAIVDLHMLAGLVNLTNRVTDPLGLEVEFPEETI